MIACVFVALLGLAGGAFVGLPGMVERAGLKAIHRLEDRFAVRLEAGQVDWTWDGRVDARNVVVRAQPAEAGAADVLATIESLSIESDIDFWERRVRVLRVGMQQPVMKVTRDAAGRTNLDGLIAALKKMTAPGAPSGLGGGVTIEPSLPIVALDGATLALDAVLPQLPLGLNLPGRATFEGGRVTLRPIGESPDGHVASTPVRLEVAFLSSTLDPGQGLAFNAEGPLAGPPTRLELKPQRPVRFWLQERVVGIGGVALTQDGIELGPLQLSVPIAKTGAAEVAAAASCEKVVLSPSPRELLGRIANALALGDEAAGPEGAQDGAPKLSRSKIAAALSAIDTVTLVKPVVSLAIDEAGHHDFADVLPEVRFAPGPPAGGLIDPAEVGLVRAVTDASLAASEKLLAPASSKKSENGKEAPKPLSARLATPFEALDRISKKRVPELVRLFKPIVMKHFAIEDGEVLLAVPGAQLTLGNLQLNAMHDGADRRDLSLSFDATDAGDPARSAIAFSLGGILDDKRVSGDLMVKDLPLTLARALGVELPHMKPVGRIAELRGELSGDLRGERWRVKGKVALEDAAFHHPSLAQDPLSDLDVTLSGEVEWDAPDGTLKVSDGLIESHGVVVKGALDIADAQRRPKLYAELEMPELPVQRLVDALPKELIPLLPGLRIDGTLRWPVTIALDTVAPDAIKIDSRPEVRGLQVLTLGDKVDFGELRAAHTYGILLGDGTPGTRMVGPMTGSWVPLGAITPYLPMALTTTEDGTFYSNDGISTNAMMESIATNLERGSFVRGASTLTQQLVKNLYLGSSKTLSRKLQEIFIAWQMAQNLSKEEVMALYLNTIEFGPGIYGIGDAAWHWFGKRPIDLTLTEAIFLASIIPGPRRYYSFFLQGAVTPRWASYLGALLKVMVERGKITEQELAAAAPYIPVFRGAGGGYTDQPPPGFDQIPEDDDLGDQPDEREHDADEDSPKKEPKLLPPEPEPDEDDGPDGP